MKFSTIFLTALFLFSCNIEKKLTCEGLVYTNGITYKNSKLFTGSCVTHHKNLELKSVQNYKEGKDHGKWTFYHDNGVIETIGTFKEGVKTGTWKYYDNNSNLRLEVTYNDMGEIINSKKTKFY